MPGERPVIALVDGHSLFHRAFFALPPLATASGQPTGAVFGFLSMLFKLLEDEKPSHLAVAFDLSGPTFRDDLFAEYKGHRPAMPDDLRSQLPILQRALGILRVPTVSQQGFEADDVIGTLSRRAALAGFGVLVVTGDRDAFQLCGQAVSVVYTRRGITDVEKLDEAVIHERYGVDPSQLVDVKALMGDTSDNIPGIPTIGEKTALKLIRSYGSVEGLLERLDEVAPPRVQAALRSHLDWLPRNKRLATIVCDAPVACDPAGCGRRDPDAGEAAALLEELEMRSLLRRLPGVARAGAAAASTEGAERGPAADAREDGGAAPAAGAGAREQTTLTVAAGDEELALRVPPLRPLDGGRLAELGEAGEMAVAVDWEDARPTALALAAPDAVYVAPPECASPPTGAGEPAAATAFPPAGAGPATAPARPPVDPAALAVAAPAQVGHDLKPWVRYVLRSGGRVPPLAFDTMVAAYLIDSGRSTYRLGDLVRAYLGRELPPDAPPAARATAGLQLRAPLQAELEARGLQSLFTSVEMPLIEVLAAMEVRGVCVDKAALATLGEEFRGRIDELAATIHALAGEPFNINSTQQLGRVLFDKLGLKPPKKTKTGYSTDAAVLEQLAAEHELPGQVLAHRTLQKLQSTYIDALQTLVGPDGRVHTTFAQTVAATGRLASTDPNLQNIPVRDEVGRRIRRAFVAPPGHRLVAVDYSQIELRVLAHLSGDPALIEAFQAGEDFHRQTAAFIFGVPAAEVTPGQRSAAKATNFGVVYGISDFGLARQLGVDNAEAHEIIQRYFARFPQVRRYLDGLVAEARTTGQVRTLFGRVRTLPDIANRNWARRSFAERMAMNSPLQGTAADLIKLAMVRAHAALREQGLSAAMVLQVHDELIFEVPDAEVDRVATLARRAMTGAAELAVPLVVEAKAGRDWYEMEPLP